MDELDLIQRLLGVNELRPCLYICESLLVDGICCEDAARTILATEVVAHLRMKNTESALESLRILRKQASDSTPHLWAECEYALATKHVENAASFAQRLINRNATLENYCYLGMAHVLERNSADSMIIAERLLRENPTFAKGWLLKAKVHLLKHESDQAFACLQECVRYDPRKSEAWSLIANAWIQSGDLQKALAMLRNAVVFAPDEVIYQIFYASYLRISGNLTEALRISKQVIDNLPEDPDIVANAWSNHGTIFHAAGQIEKALAAYTEARKINPNLHSVENNLGGLYLQRNDPQNAYPHCAKAYALKPHDVDTINNYALCLAQKGEYTESLNIYHTLLESLQKNYPAQFIFPKVAAMSVPLADEAILALHDALQALGVPFFLTFGTLLGVIRDGRLLDHDKDMDIGLFFDVPRKKLLDDLKPFGFLPDSNLGTVQDDDPLFNYSVAKKDNNIAIDFFFFKEEGDKLVTGIDFPNCPLRWAFPRFDLSKRTWLGKTWFVPNPPGTFLESVYGKTWTIPDPYFDTLLSGKNRNKAADGYITCVVYGKLCDHLRRCSWDKALGLIEQIQHLREDPKLTALLPWIEARKAETKTENA